MRKLLCLSLVLGLGFALGALSFAPILPVHAGPNGPTATENGDTNGDGNIDVSDAVYLLRALFTGGPDIVKIECPDTSPTSLLVASGQTQCLGEAGIVDCSAPKARGQDPFYKLGCPFDGRFTDNGDGTITDHCTKLMWTKTYVDVDGDGEILFDKDATPWLQACQHAEDMTYLGHSDWRLPNIEELLSIMNFGEPTGPGRTRPYMSVFGFAGSWSSTHDGTNGLAAGELVSSQAGLCECSTLKSVRDQLVFAAVRSL